MQILINEKVGIIVMIMMLCIIPLDTRCLRLIKVYIFVKYEQYGILWIVTNINYIFMFIIANEDC